MTYRIEITADTLSELGGKLLALASQFHTTAVDPVMPEVKAAEPAKAKTPKAKKEEVGNEPPAPSADAPSATATSEPDTAPAPTATSPSETLDFDKDITPMVLRVVAEKGRDKALEILGQFGAGRASEVPEAQWGELYSMLQDAL